MSPITSSVSPHVDRGNSRLKATPDMATEASPVAAHNTELSQPKRVHEELAAGSEVSTTASSSALQDHAASLAVKRVKVEDIAPVETECIICMEVCNQVTDLPCHCKLQYCRACWDTALANSFSQSGQARCPSCRAPICVDFDVEKECLVFSLETVDTTFSRQREQIRELRQEYETQLVEAPSRESFVRFIEARGESMESLRHIDQLRQRAVDKLRRQAMPAQRKILRDFGVTHQSVLNLRRNTNDVLAQASVEDLKELMQGTNVKSDSCLEKTELIQSVEATVQPAQLCGAWVSLKCPAPSCICGHGLERIRGVERFRQSLGERGTRQPDDSLQAGLEHLETQGVHVVICDLCEKHVPLSTDSVWTCTNRNSTILHATSYDVCDSCFAKAVWSVDEDTSATAVSEEIIAKSDAIVSDNA